MITIKINWGTDPNVVVLFNFEQIARSSKEGLGI
jgi:hypothetical protein